MKLHLTALSFIPLFIIFLGTVWFRFELASMLVLIAMILWTMSMPFLIVFLGEVVFVDKKKATKGDGSDVVQKEKKQQDQQGKS